MIEQQAHFADDLALSQLADKPVHQRRLRGGLDNADLPSENHIDMRTRFALPEHRLAGQIDPFNRLCNQRYQLFLGQRLEQRRRGKQAGIGPHQRLRNRLRRGNRLAGRVAVQTPARLLIQRRHRACQPGAHARAQHRRDDRPRQIIVGRPDQRPSAGSIRFVRQHDRRQVGAVELGPDLLDQPDPVAMRQSLVHDHQARWHVARLHERRLLV